jgi:hypothetical protein
VVRSFRSSRTMKESSQYLLNLRNILFNKVQLAEMIFQKQFQHHHGEASTSDMDGWAEQYICAGETKVRHCSSCLRKLRVSSLQVPV